MQRMGLVRLDTLPIYDKMAPKKQVILQNCFRVNKAFNPMPLVFILLVMFGFYFVMSWTPKILISMGMSPDQGVSTGILISIGGILVRQLLAYWPHVSKFSMRSVYF